MKKLSLLILCLLVTCKVFTQNDTIKKNKYVFLTEEQAKANIKELIEFDALKEISFKQDERINNLKKTIDVYKDVLDNKDVVISKKDEIIDLQNKIINSKKPIEIHSYIGMETFELDYNSPSIYVRGAFEFKKFNIGAKGNYRPKEIYNLPTLDFNIYVEFKLFF